jgi:hypothetical protein
MSGTLITCYALADLLASRRARGVREAAVPRGLRMFVAVAMLGYYALIGPTGGPLLGGFGNLAGIGVVLGAIALRWSVMPHAGIAGKALCCAGLPIATGVPWGIVVLTLPAVAASIFWWRRARVAAAASPSPGPSSTRS